MHKVCHWSFSSGTQAYILGISPAQEIISISKSLIITTKGHLVGFYAMFIYTEQLKINKLVDICTIELSIPKLK